MEVVLAILGQEIRLECAPAEERRLRDLATALEARLKQRTSSSPQSDGERGANLKCVALAGASDMPRLMLTALSLLDEVQAARAALARACGEVERLTDIVVEARLAAGSEPADADRGRVGALRMAQGSA